MIPAGEPRLPAQLRVLRIISQNAHLFEHHAGDAAVTEALAAINTISVELVGLEIAPLNLQAQTDHRAAYARWVNAALNTLEMGEQSVIPPDGLRRAT